MGETGKGRGRRSEAGDDRDHGRGRGHGHGRRHSHERGHGHGHGIGHAHGHGHGHAVSAEADRRLLSGALALILGFMAIEVVIGVIAHSLALVSDAGHMLTDAIAIAFAIIAMRIAARPPQGGFTYGLKRAEIISAQINGITLLLLSVYFVYEAVRRLIEPPEVHGPYVVATGIAGIAVNLAATWLLSRANRASLNVEGAFQHILNDLFAFIATTAAGAVIWLTGWGRADALAALVVAALMLKAGWGLVRESGRVFMEAAPAGMNPAEIGRKTAALEHVVEVHDLHIWEVTSGYPAMSAHILVAPGADCHAVRQAAQRMVHDEYGIAHTTLQVDHAPPELLAIGEPAAEARPHCATTAADQHRAGAAEPHCVDAHGPIHTNGSRPLTKESTRNAEASARKAESPAENTDSSARKADGSARNAEVAAKSADSSTRSVESPAKNTNSSTGNADNSTRNAEVAAKSTDSSTRSAESLAGNAMGSAGERPAIAFRRYIKFSSPRRLSNRRS